MSLFGQIVLGTVILLLNVEWIGVVFFGMPLSSGRLFEGDWGMDVFVRTSLGKILYTLVHSLFVFILIAMLLKKRKPEHQRQNPKKRKSNKRR